MTVHYNGFPGKTRDEAWATWNVSLWIANDEAYYLVYRCWIRRFTGRRGPFAADAESFARELFPNGTPDMESGDMDDVNWAHLAKSWRSDK